MHKSLDEFEFRPDPTTDYGVICPWASKKIDVTTFSPLLLIRSFSNLQVMRTCIISWMSSNFGQIWPRTMELAALERWKKFPLTYNWENYVISFSWLFLIGSFSYLQVMRTYIKAYISLNFGQIPPLTTELAALERLKNRCHHVISVDIDPIFFKLAGNKDMHNIMNEFEFWPDRTTDYGVSCPWAS